MEKDFDLKDLRSVWQNQTEGKTYSQQEIFFMLKRKSITNVKWIFFIFLFEFGLFLFLSLISYGSFDDIHKEYNKDFGKWAVFFEIVEILSIVMNVMILIWIFKKFKSLKVENSVRKLSKDLIHIREVVKYFIYYSIFMAIFAIIVMGYYDRNFIEYSPQQEGLEYFILFFSSILILFLFYLYYYFVYGTFLRRLKRNLKSLQSLDE